MSEQKKASLTTIGSNKKEKKVKEPRRTVRLKVNLSESNEKTCPEYNYVDLLNSVEKRRKKKNDASHIHSTANGLGDLDPFDDDDEEKLKEIARNFEERYGPSITKKKCRKREDYLDIGAGYDETDPFIDNTDAYDEIVPEEMTTAHGGFYINSGALEYKRVEHTSDLSDAEEIKNNKSKKKSKKILVSDDDEEDSEEEEDLEEKSEVENKKLKIKEPEEETNASNKRKIISKESDAVIKKKRKTVDGLVKKKSMTVKDLLKEKRETEKPETKPTPVIIAATPAPPVAPVAAADNANAAANSTISVVEPKKSPTTSITDVIESVISAARGHDESSSSSSSSLSKSHSDSSESSDEEDSQNGSEKEKQPQKEEIKLPDNLPEDLKCIIVLLKNAAKTSVEGKCKFFSTEVNRLLLRIERSSKTIGVVNRNLVYSHLSSYVPCTKDTLMKRAKKLVIESEEDKLKEPMRRLKAMIDKMMPSVIEKHTKDCQTVAEENPQIYWELYRYYWGLEDSSVAANAGGDAKSTADGKKVKSGIPLRVFPWNEEVRSLLCEVVKIKLQSFELSKPRKESAKDYLKQFFESEVKSLWPPGWMKTIILYRESRSVHCNTMTKPSKPAVGAKKSNSTQSVGSPKPTPANSPASKASISSTSVVSTAPPSSLPVSAATITAVSSISSTVSTTASSNISPSVSIIKCPTSQTTTITPSQRASSPSSRATITSVSSGPRVSSPLLINSTNAGKGKTVSNGDAEVPKNPVRTKASSDSTRESVVTKNPVMLPQVHLPDCISVTPAHSMPAPANKSPSTPIMSLKQRILQDAAAASSSKQSSEGVSEGKSPPKAGGDDCEVLLVGEKREGKLSVPQVRHSGSHQPKSHPMSMGHKGDIGVPSRGDVDKDTAKKDNRNSCVPRLSPPKEDKTSEGRLVDETVTATDVLSQIINSSLGGFPNASTIGKSGVGVESLTQRREHHNDRHLGMLSRNVGHVDHEGKEKGKDSVRGSQNSRVDNSLAAVNDAEESVQLEVDRVMKELLELREMTEDSMESEIDKRGSHFRPNDKASSSMPTHMLSSSVSVIAVNSASSKHHTANSQTKMNSSSGQISSSVTNSSQSAMGTAALSKRSQSMPYGGAVNPIPSTKSYGFQDEFQRHVLQDCGKNLVDGDGALYMGNKVHKDGERNRTANYNSVYQSIPQSSPAGLERNRGLHNASVDGTNDHNRVLMSVSQLKNTAARHRQNSPPNAHQFTRHSLPTHNSSEMESCPNINFSGNCVKPRVSSQQFSRPEILTQSTNSQLGNFGKIVKHSNLLASSLPQYQGMKPYPMRPDSSSPPGPAPHSTKY